MADDQFERDQLQEQERQLVQREQLEQAEREPQRRWQEQEHARRAAEAREPGHPAPDDAGGAPASRHEDQAG